MSHGGSYGLTLMFLLEMQSFARDNILISMLLAYISILSSFKESQLNEDAFSRKRS